MRASAGPTLLDVEAVVVGYYHISVEELLKEGKHYKRPDCEIEPRYVAWWLARTVTTAAPYAVADYFQRDPTMVRWGMRKVEQLRIENPDFTAKLAELSRLIKQEALTISPIRARLQMNHPTQRPQQRNNGPEQDDSPDEHKDQHADDAHEGFGHVLGDDGLKQAPNPVDEARDQQDDNQLDDQVHHVVGLRETTP